MTVVPAGVFVMGAPAAGLDDARDLAERQTTVIRIERPFALGLHEVTRGEFAAFVRDAGYEIRAGCRTWDDALARFNDDARRTWLDPGRPVEPGERHPINCVSWADAQAYVQWLARKTGQPYRLPSAAEWEYAARAGSTTPRFWGTEPQEGCDHANTYDLTARAAHRLGWADAGCSDGYPDLAPVGQFKPNALGLHDMIGNVAEWTEDCWTGSYVGRPKDGSAWTWLGGCERRVLRGGGWVSSPERSRSGYHGEAPATDRADYIGFRVALDLDRRTRSGRELR
jgi:formylglycine-generating enzyme required for sulfatase activity